MVLNSLIKGGIPFLLSLCVVFGIDFGTDAVRPVSLLAITTANLAADALIIFVGFYSGIVWEKSNVLTWYDTYGLSAVLADTLIGIIYMCIAHEISEGIALGANALTYFTLLALATQWVGDILFYAIFTIVPKGKNYVFDRFKLYAHEAGLGALLGDSFLVVVASLVASGLEELSNQRHVLYVLIGVAYLIPYLVHTRSYPVLDRVAEVPADAETGNNNNSSTAPKRTTARQHEMSRSRMMGQL